MKIIMRVVMIIIIKNSDNDRNNENNYKNKDNNDNKYEICKNHLHLWRHLLERIQFKSQLQMPQSYCRCCRG